MLQDMSGGESDGEIVDPSFFPDEESSSQDEKRCQLLLAGKGPLNLPLSFPSGAAAEV